MTVPTIAYVLIEPHDPAMLDVGSFGDKPPVMYYQRDSGRWSAGPYDTRRALVLAADGEVYRAGCDWAARFQPKRLRDGGVLACVTRLFSFPALPPGRSLASLGTIILLDANRRPMEARDADR